MISDSGLTGVADPGSKLILLCHKYKIPLIASSGPSSIFLGLMLSGLNGNCFAFHGYLPKKEDFLREKLQLLEKRSEQEKSCHIFIEAPYRSHKLFATLLSSLQIDTYLFVGKCLGSDQEEARTKRISAWKKSPVQLGKEPCIFIISREHFYKRHKKKTSNNKR